MKFKLVESSLGVRTTEAVARRVDELLPTLPAELRSIRRKDATDGTQAVETTTRTATGFVSTRAVDRDFEIVEPAGIDLDQYRANPVVLFGHDQDRPCGKSLWIKATGEGLIAKTFFQPRPASYEGEWLPDFVFSMIAADVLRGFSIGFLPLDIREPTREELEAEPRLQRVITRALLVEYSVVAVPSNPAALVSAVGKGLSLKGWNWTTVRKGSSTGSKRKPGPNYKNLKLPAPPSFSFDPERIAEEAVKNILRKWEA